MKKKVVIIGLLLLLVLLLPMLLLLTFFAGSMSAAEESMVTDYNAAAEEIGGSWQAMLAFDTVRYDNDFADVNPYMTALEFTIIDYTEYTWHPPRTDDTDDVGYWTLKKSGTLDTPDEIRRYFGLDDLADLKDVLAAMETYAQPKPYQFIISAKSIEAIMEDYNFTEEQKIRMGLLITEGLLSAQFGDTVPGSFAVDGSGYFAWPLPGITADGLTSSFGGRIHPVTGVQSFHYGLDIACPIGTPVLAVADGIVQSTGSASLPGNYVVLKVQKDDINWVIKYFHLSEIKCRPGDAVKAGDVIALSGSTGRVTGPHLHIETICNGVYQDPLPLLKQNDD